MCILHKYTQFERTSVMMFDHLLADPENRRVREAFKEHGIGNEEQKFIKYLMSGEGSTEPANDQVRVLSA